MIVAAHHCTQAVLFAKEVIPYLTGRVLVQTSPSAAYDTDKTVAHAERFVQLFEAEGIPRCVRQPLRRSTGMD